MNVGKGGSVSKRLVWSGAMVLAVWAWWKMSQVLNESMTMISLSNQDYQEAEVGASLQRETSDGIDRPWDSVGHRRWCRSQDGMSQPPGLIYVKIPKTASSTLAGINIRLARKIGAQVLPTLREKTSWWPWSGRYSTHRSTPCTHTFRHGRDALEMRQTIPIDKHSSTLLWTFLRDPAARGLSEYYHFKVGRRGARTTDGWQTSFLNQQKNYQFLYIMDHPQPKVLLQEFLLSTGNDSNATAVDSTTLNASVQKAIDQYVLQSYDYIGLVERMEESLVVMKLLWGLETEDLIVLSAKTSGGYDDGRYNGTCVHIPKVPNPLSDYLQDYIATRFRKDNWDYLLYELVDRRLDATIQSLGKARVAQKVERLRTLQRRAELVCASSAIFPCSSNGTLQWEASMKDCYAFDSGCGFGCVDQALGNLDPLEP